MTRLAYREVSPAAYRALLTLESQVRRSGLGNALLDLIYLRVSQLNGCVFCVDAHARDLRKAGETADRLALLPVWRDAPVFTKRERAALGWAEALTTLSTHAANAEFYEAARGELGDTALVELTLAIAAINSWNRMNIAFQTPPAAGTPVP
jgi:AhpD family alkylhydroperoxidase